MLHRHHAELDHDGIAGHHMRTEFAMLGEAALLPEVAAAMDRGHLDDLPVTKPGGEVTGIVRREDLHGHPRGVTAGDVAHHELEYARYDEPVPEVVAHMRAAHLSALPVVTSDGYVEGIVVLDDLAAVAPVTARAWSSRWRESARDWLVVAGIGRDDTIPAATAAGSVGLLTLAMIGLACGAPGWLSAVDATAAVVAAVAATTSRTPELLGVALTAFLTAVLAIAWIFARATGVPGWFSWLHLLLAVGLAALTAAAARLAPRLAAQRL